MVHPESGGVKRVKTSVMSGAIQYSLSVVLGRAPLSLSRHLGKGLAVSPGFGGAVSAGLGAAGGLLLAQPAPSAPQPPCTLPALRATRVSHSKRSNPPRRRGTPVALLQATHMRQIWLLEINKHFYFISTTLALLCSGQTTYEKTFNRDCSAIAINRLINHSRFGRLIDRCQFWFPFSIQFGSVCDSECYWRSYFWFWVGKDGRCAVSLLSNLRGWARPPSYL